MKKKCEQCRKAFQSKRSDARFCSVKCRVAALRMKKRRLKKCTPAAQSIPPAADHVWKAEAMRRAQYTDMGEDGFCATSPLAPGCTGTGESEDLARADFAAALVDWVEVMLARGGRLPAV